MWPAHICSSTGLRPICRRSNRLRNSSFGTGGSESLLLSSRSPAPPYTFHRLGGAFFFYFSNFKPIKRKKISLIRDIFIQHLLIQKLLLFFQLVLDLLLLHIGLIQLLLFCLLLLGL